MKKIVIAGGSGFLGSVLLNYFSSKGNHVIVLTRNKKIAGENDNFKYWDGKSISDWISTLEGADVLINLAGKSVDCRYTSKNKEHILASRVDSTSVLNKAVLLSKNPPKLWLNSSTATIYRHSLDKEMNESDGEIGSDFSMDVAKTWEKVFFETITPKTRKVALRTSIVLGKQGGAFVPLKKLAKMGFGGKQANGAQFVSWIHETDFCRALSFIIDNHKITGPINIVSPSPVPNHEFMMVLSSSLKKRIRIPINTFFLELGAFMIRTETELILKSRRVIPGILKEKEFKFIYNDLESAIKDLLKK